MNGKEESGQKKTEKTVDNAGGFSIDNATLTGVAINSPGATATGTMGGAAAPIPVPADLAELRRGVADLVARIESAEEALEDRAELADVAKRLGSQLERTPPNRHLVKGFLHGLAEGLRGIAPLAGSVAAITKAIRDLLGIG